MADSSSLPQIDCTRIIAHFDVDCFYAQAEILRQPQLRDRSVGITQKFLVVTCNYVARQCGVPKMASVEEARRRCPDIVLINGEDLTPYRAASKEIMNVLRRFGTLERSGLDECGVDITCETKKRAALAPLPNHFLGFVLGFESVREFANIGIEESRLIPMDSGLGDSILYSAAENKWEEADSSKITSGIENQLQSVSSDDMNLFMVGSHLVAEIRSIVEAETGFQCSCGISYNKMLAKLACSANKPNKQTCLLKSAVPQFLCPLSVRKLPGVGHRTEAMLNEIGIQTVADLQTCSLQKLLQMFGDRTGRFLFNACRGVDLSPVRDKGPLKSVSVENSFPPCTSLKGIEVLLSSLAPDFIARLDEDRVETGRRPRVFTVKWRQKGSASFTSASTQMPLELLSTKCLTDRRKEILVQTGMSLVSRSLRGNSFAVVVLNIGATNFTDSYIGSSSASQDIRSLLRNSTKIQESGTASKHEMMSIRQAAETDHSRINHSCPSLFDQRTSGCSVESSISGDLLCKSSLDLGISNGETCRKNKMTKSNAISEDGNDEVCRFASADDVRTAISDTACRETYSMANKELAQEKSKGDVCTREFEEQFVQTETADTDNLEIGVCVTAASVATETILAETSCVYFQEGNSEQGNTRKRGIEMRENDIVGCFVCEKCGQKMGCDEQAKLEHEDYHYALELHSKETNNWRNQSNHLSGNSYLKKRKQNLTLDSFFSRSK